MSQRRTVRSSVWMASLLGACALTAAGCGVEDDGSELAQLSEELKVAAAQGKFVRAERPIAGQYIVVFREDELTLRSQRASAVGLSMAQSVGAKMVHGYEHALQGFAAKMSEASVKALAETFTKLQVMERVAFSLDDDKPNETDKAVRMTDAERAVRIFNIMSRVQP